MYSILLPDYYKFVDKSVINEQQVFEYFKRWYKIIEQRLEKHKNKLLKMIDEVVEDNRGLMEMKDEQNFDEYFDYLKT